MKIAFLTAGGIAPCLSSSIGALIEQYATLKPEAELIGYLNGYRGLLLGKSIKFPESAKNNFSVLYEFGGGFKEDVKALQIGGPLGGVVPIQEVEKLNLDFQEFTTAGFMLGHASIVSIPKDFPMVEYIHHLFEFTAEESCGKCFPGRLGSYRGKEMFDQLKSKTSKIPLKLLNELLVTMKKGCLCALCGAIPTPIMNILKYFGDEMKNDMVQEN